MATRIEEILLRVRTELGDAVGEISGLAGLLQALEGKQTGVDVDVHVAKALAEVKTVDKALDVLDKKSVDVEVDVATKTALAEIEQLQLTFEKLDGETITIDTKLKGTAAEEAGQLQLLLSGMEKQEHNIHVALKDNALLEAEKIQAQLERIQSMHAETTADLNIAPVETNAAQLEMLFATLDGRTVTVDATLDGSQAVDEAGQLQLLLQNLDHEKATPKITLDEQIAGDIAAIDAELSRIGDETIQVQLDAGAALAEAELLNREVAAALTNKHIEVDIDTSNALVQAYALNKALDLVLSDHSGGGGGAAGKAFGEIASAASEAEGPVQSVGISIGQMSFRIGAAVGPIIVLGGAIIGVLVAALSALVASAASAAGALVTLGVAAAAALGPALVLVGAIVQRFGKIMAAKKAQDDAATDATKRAATSTRDAAAAEEQRRSAMNAVRDAREQLTSAERAYGEAVKRAKKDIEDAEKAEQDAHTRTSEALRNQRLAAAETARAREDAAQRITDAAKKAADEEVNLSRTVRDGGRDIASAQQAIADASDKVSKTLVDANRAIADSFRDARDAALDLKFAQLDLTDSQAQVKDLEKQITDLMSGAGVKNPMEQLQKLTDVQLQGANVQDMFPGISKDSDSAQKLEDLLRQLARAKLNVEGATNKLSDAEVNLSDKQAINAKYVKDGVNAYDPYTQAVKASQDAQDNLALTTERVSEAVGSANDRLKQAQSDLKVLQDAGVAGSDGVRAALERERDARLRVAAAQDNERDAEGKLNDLRKQGIAGSPAVISAAERVRDAQQNLAEALHRQSIAGKNVGAGVGDMTAAQFKAKQATDQLSDAEVRLLDAIRGILKAFREMTQGGVDAFFTGLAEAIKIITPVMKQLAPAFTDLGKAFGEVAVALAKELVRPENVKFFKDMAGAAADLVRIIGTDALISFFRILRNIATAAMPFLIKGAQDFADTLKEWAKATGNTSKLGGIIGHLVVSLGKWVDLALSLSDLFFAVIQDIAPAGDALVGWISDAAKGLSKWTKSAEGARILKQFFQDGLPLIKQFVRFIGLLAVAFLQVWSTLAPILAPVLDTINDLFLALIRVYQLIKDAMRPMILGFVAALQKVSDVIGSVLDSIGKLAEKGSEALNKILAPFEDFSKKGVQAGKDIINGLVDGIGNKVQDIVKAITGWWDDVLAFFGVHSPAKKGIELGEALVNGIVGGVKNLAEDLLKAGKWIWSQIQDGIHAVENKVKETALWIKDKIIDFIKSAVTDIKNVGGWIVNRVSDGVQGVTASLVSAAAWIKDKIVEFVKNRIADFTGVGGWIVNRVSDGVQAVTASLGSAANWIQDKIVEFIKARITDFTSVGSWIANRVSDGVQLVTKGIDEAANWIQNKVIGFIKDRVKDFTDGGEWILARIIDGAKNAPAAIYNRLKDFVDNIVNKVKDFLGIKSPSRVFMGIGEQMAAGLFNGFSSGDVVGFVEKNLGGLKKIAPSIIAKGLIKIEDIPMDALEKMGDFGAKLINKIFGGSGDGKLPKGTAGYDGHPQPNHILDPASILAHAVGLVVTSTTDHSKFVAGSNRVSDHYAGHAMDVSNGVATPEEKEFFLKAIKIFGNKIKQMLHTPMGYGYSRGAKTPPYAAADHYNHVHFAMAQGGLVKDRIFAEIGEGVHNEAVLPLSRAVFAKLAEGIVTQLNVASTRFPMPSIATPLSTQTGSMGGGGISIGQVVLPPVVADQNGFDGRQGAALFMQELRSRGGLVGA